MNITEFSFSFASDRLPTPTTSYKMQSWKTELLETLFDIDKNSLNCARFSLKRQQKLVSTLEMQG